MENTAYNTEITTYYPTLEQLEEQRLTHSDLAFNMARLDFIIDEGPYLNDETKLISMYEEVLQIITNLVSMSEKNPTLHQSVSDFFQNRRLDKVVAILLGYSFLIPLRADLKYGIPVNLPNYKIIENIKLVVELIYSIKPYSFRKNLIQVASTVGLLVILEDILERLLSEKRDIPDRIMKHKDSIQIIKVKKLKKEIVDIFGVVDDERVEELSESFLKSDQIVQITFLTQIVEETIDCILSTCRPELFLMRYLNKKSKLLKTQTEYTKFAAEFTALVSNFGNAFDKHEILEEDLEMYRQNIENTIRTLLQRPEMFTLNAFTEINTVFSRVFGKEILVNITNASVTVIKRGSLHPKKFSTNDYRSKLANHKSKEEIEPSDEPYYPDIITAVPEKKHFFGSNLGNKKSSKWRFFSWKKSSK